MHERERSFVHWLDSIAPDAEALYLLGDIFDFWWEYKHVVPKGYVRVLGRLAQLADAGVAIHFFKGNHDQWTFGYLEKEIGMQVHHEPLVIEIGKTRFYLGHGDKVEQTGWGYRLLKNMFSSRPLQRCFGTIHPRWGVGLGYDWSARNRKRHRLSYQFTGEIDPFYRFASKFPHPVDCFVFGHLHTPVDVVLPNQARLIVLSEWMPHGHYAVFDTRAGIIFVSCIFSIK